MSDVESIDRAERINERRSDWSRSARGRSRSDNSEDDLPVERPEAVVLTEFADCKSDTIVPDGVVEQVRDLLVERIVELGLVV